MTQRKAATPSLAIIDALDSLAAEVRRNHPEVPDNIVIALASGKSRGGAIHGHFAPESWKDGHEILMSGESLERGAVATFGTLVHELAHARAHVTGVRDTSNNGRYHNTRFKKIGEEMGISLEQGGTIGWSVTTVPDSTVQKYQRGIEKLERALVTYRKGFSAAAAPKPKTPPKKTKLKVSCDCEDNEVTVSILWFLKNEGNLVCEECGDYYKEV